MPFEPNDICPVAAADCAARLHRRIAERDALLADLAPRILGFVGCHELKSISGTLRRANTPDDQGELVSFRTREPVGTAVRVADVATARRAGIRQNPRRSRVGA